jgi:hypothetical protein
MLPAVLFAFGIPQPKDLSPMDLSAFGVPLDPPSVSASARLHEDDAARRRRESEQIQREYERELQKRSPQRTMSPEYLATLPSSLAEKLRVTPEEEELILYYYAATASVPKTAEACGVSLDKVRAIVYNPRSQSAISDFRDEMRLSVINKIEETQSALLEALQDPDKLRDSSLTQISSVFAQISETQLSLRTAERESARASASIADPTVIFTGEELEYMALLRRRVSSGGTPLELPFASQDPSHHSMDGHDFVDSFGAVQDHSEENDEDDSIQEAELVERGVPKAGDDE